MGERRYRLLLAFTHPVQYTSPVLRETARHSNLDIMAAYCSLQGAEVTWDVPILDGYPWVQVPNRSPRPSLNRFFGLINPGLWTMIRKGDYDVVVAYTGYANASFWILAAASKVYRVPLIFGTDATSLRPRDGRNWKIVVKKFLLPAIFRLADFENGGVAIDDVGIDHRPKPRNSKIARFPDALCRRQPLVARTRCRSGPARRPTEMGHPRRRHCDLVLR